MPGACSPVMAWPLRVPVIASIKYPPLESGLSAVIKVPLAVTSELEKFQSQTLEAAEEAVVIVSTTEVTIANPKANRGRTKPSGRIVERLSSFQIPETGDYLGLWRLPIERVNLLRAVIPQEKR